MTVLVTIGDLHIGSSTAIAPPTFEIHTGRELETQEVKHNKLQEWLWGNWLDFWDYARVKAKRQKLIVVCLGDVLDGIHHGSTQLISEIEDQKELAIRILEPVRNIANQFYGILGTEAHAGPNARNEIDIYESLSANAYNQQMTLDIDGYIHDFAHHGRVGQRAWTSLGANLAADVIIDYARCGMLPPNYIWRAHNHTIDDSGFKHEGTRAISIPTWQLKTTYSWRVTFGKVRSDIGGILWDSKSDQVDFTKARYKAQPDERKVIVA